MIIAFVDVCILFAAIGIFDFPPKSDSDCRYFSDSESAIIDLIDPDANKTDSNAKHHYDALFILFAQLKDNSFCVPLLTVSQAASDGGMGWHELQLPGGLISSPGNSLNIPKDPEIKELIFFIRPQIEDTAWYIYRVNLLDSKIKLKDNATVKLGTIDIASLKKVTECKEMEALYDKYNVAQKRFHEYRGRKSENYFEVHLKQ